MRGGGRIAAYLRLPDAPTESLLAERGLLKLAKQHGWEYVRFFRETPQRREQWESLLQALGRGEIRVLLMMSLDTAPGSALQSLVPLILNKGVRLLTVREELDSWSDQGRALLQSLMTDPRG